MGRFGQRARGMREEYLRDLRQIVDMDSPTDDKAAVDAVGRVVRGWLEAAGGTVETFPQTERGDHLRATWAGAAGSPTVVLVGHIDTVFSMGSVATRPFTITGNRVNRLRRLGHEIGHPQRHLCAAHPARSRMCRCRRCATSSIRTRKSARTPPARLIEETAKGADAAYILEPGRAVGPGCVVTTRKGIGLYNLRVTGKAAHAGGEPWRGRSATLEMAHKIIALHALTTPGLSAGNTDGVSVNVGVVRGGTRRNVVAAEAIAEIDVRVPTAAAAAETEAAMRAIAANATVPDTTGELTGGINRPPMERHRRARPPARHRGGDSWGIRHSGRADRHGRRLGRQLHRRHRHADARRPRPDGWRRALAGGISRPLQPARPHRPRRLLDRGDGAAGGINRRDIFVGAVSRSALARAIGACTIGRRRAMQRRGRFANRPYEYRWHGSFRCPRPRSADRRTAAPADARRRHSISRSRRLPTRRSSMAKARMSDMSECRCIVNREQVSRYITE